MVIHIFPWIQVLCSGGEGPGRRWKGPLNVLILVHIYVSVVPRGSHLRFRPTYGLHSDLTGIPLRLLDPEVEEVLQNLESGESDQCFLELVYSSP